MFIIVTTSRLERVNILTVRKYRDYEIKFANDHIIKVKETAKEIDMMIWAANILKCPVNLEKAEELFKKIKEEENGTTI